MPRQRLTDRFVRSLKPHSETEYWDTVVEKLVLRALPSGTRTWFVRYYAGGGTSSRGKYRRMKIGRYPDTSLSQARDEARALIVRERRGEDPGGWREKADAEWTFERLSGEYLERHARPKKSSWKEDQRILTKDLLPAFAGMPANAVLKRHAIELLDGIVDRGSPVMANRTRALLSRIYTFGLSRDIVQHNPVLGTEPPGEEGRRDRVLSYSELQTLWTALSMEHPVLATGVKLLILTGQRSSSVRGMEHGQIDGDWWTIPTRLFKSRRPHRVFLAPQARALLSELPRTRSDLVLPSPRGGDKLERTAFARVTRRIVRRHELEPFSPHDLRRTAASKMAELGVQRFVVERVLGHADASVTGRYDLYEYDREKKEALRSWGKRIQGLFSGSTRSSSAGHSASSSIQN